MPNGGPSTVRRPAAAPAAGEPPAARLRPAAAAPLLGPPAAGPPAAGGPAAAVQAWVSVATGGLRRDGLPAVEEILGRRVTVAHPDTGLPVSALLDIHAVDRSSGSWYRAAIPAGPGTAVIAVDRTFGWRYVRARWEGVPRPAF